MKNKLYVLVDRDLDPIYGAVQGGHAVAEWLFNNYEFNIRNNDIKWSWNNDYLIYISVNIKKWYKKLKRFDPSIYQWSSFVEPDLNNKMTAIAVYANDFPDYIIDKLSHEKLLKSGE